jgi:hypothetical protein
MADSLAMGNFFATAASLVRWDSKPTVALPEMVPSLEILTSLLIEEPLVITDCQVPEVLCFLLAFNSSIIHVLKMPRPSHLAWWVHQRMRFLEHGCAVHCIKL